MISLVLDNQKAMNSIDKDGMLQAVESLPIQLKESFLITEKANLNINKTFDSILFFGLGGSGIVGNLVEATAKDDIEIPLMVHKKSSLPNWVSSKTLCFAISYSGDTKETCENFKDALTKQATLISISSGGRLKILSQESNTPFIE